MDRESVTLSESTATTAPTGAARKEPELAYIPLEPEETAREESLTRGPAPSERGERAKGKKP
jgi:hypothetical protein